jgi:hypothetical protein
MRARGSIVAVLAVLCMAGGVLGISAGVALAASKPAVDSQGASAVGPFGATLEAQVNPEAQETTCVRFEYGTSAAYGSSAPCANGSLGAGSEDQPASAAVTGLRPGTEYHFRVVVENASSPVGGTDGADQTFTTPLVIEGGASFSAVSDRGAVVSAPVDAGGVPTTFYVEYGPTVGYGSRTPGVVLSGGEQVNASARLGGLAPGSEYHFRVVSESEGGVREESGDGVFRTLAAGVQGLPDGRVFEMVTPVENQDAEAYAPYAFNGGPFYVSSSLYGLPTRFPFQAAADGGSVVYVANPTSPGGNGESGLDKGNDYFATRSADGGWTHVNLQPLGYKVYLSNEPLYQAFSSDLSTGVLGIRSNEYQPPLTPGAPGGGDVVLYTRAMDADTYSPLFTTTPPDESGESFGTYSFEVKTTRFAGASADFSRSLFEANDALSPEAVNGGEGENNLYVSAGGDVRSVNILPGATASAPNAVFGGPSDARFAASPDFSHVISADGSRIFWTDLNAGPDEDHVFVRENGTSTVAVSAGAARFWTASTDGRYAFYTEGEQLLRFDVDTQTREVLAGDGAEVQGVPGASEDGSYVYFAADGSLAQGAQPGQPNLYLLHNSGNGWEPARFIATLQAEDGSNLNNERNELANAGDWEPDLGERTAEATADGQGLVFMSRASLPAVGFPHGYENTGLAEVYSYQAAGGGRLYCVSCNMSGEPPRPNFETERDERVAAFLPVGFQKTYQPRWVSADGDRVFFDSTQALVPRDTNGVLDAYEWESDGEGTCTQPDGCDFLLSSGNGGTASYFVDASTSGNDAFVVTRDRLVPQDQNENYDLYDARVGGVNVLSSAGCTGESCQAAAAPSVGLGAPASATFTGAGNLTPAAPAGGTPVKPKPRAKPLSRARLLARALKACAAKPKRVRAMCERQARRRYGPKLRAKKTGLGNAKRGGRS